MEPPVPPGVNGSQKHIGPQSPIGEPSAGNPEEEDNSLLGAARALHGVLEGQTPEEKERIKGEIFDDMDTRSWRRRIEQIRSEQDTDPLLAEQSILSNCSPPANVVPLGFLEREAPDLLEAGRNFADYHQTIDHHHALIAKVKEANKQRKESHEALEVAIQECVRSIALAPDAAVALLGHPSAIPKKDRRLPGHPGYRNLSIIREQRGEYGDAIRLCEEARAQGWARTDDWDKRIERCKKKLANEQGTRS